MKITTLPFDSQELRAIPNPNLIYNDKFPFKPLLLGNYIAFANRIKYFYFH